DEAHHLLVRHVLPSPAEESLCGGAQAAVRFGSLRVALAGTTLEVETGHGVRFRGATQGGIGAIIGRGRAPGRQRAFLDGSRRRMAATLNAGATERQGRKRKHQRAGARSYERRPFRSQFRHRISRAVRLPARRFSRLAGKRRYWGSTSLIRNV